MPRQARKVSNSGIYHAMLRGINRSTIFHDEEDCKVFLSILSAVRKEYPFDLFAWCLMGNHVHLLLRVGCEKPDSHNESLKTELTISSLFKRLGVRYAGWYNHKYQRSGHLFQDRFRSVPVETDEQFLATLRYILRNPIKAGLCAKIEEYQWSGFELKALPLEIYPNQLEIFLNENADDIPNPFPERLTDSEAESMLQKTANVRFASDLSSLPKEELIPLFRKVLSQGINILQLSRLTGISKSNIARWVS